MLPNRTSKIHESIVVGCVSPACVDHTCFFNGHLMSVLVEGAPVQGGPQVNKFEQVSNLDHWISLVGVGTCTEGEALYRFTQDSLPSGPNDRQTRLKNLPSRDFVGGM